LTLFDVRGIAIGQLISEYAQAPNIDLAIVLILALDQLRSHPANGAHATRPMVSLVRELGRVAEVCQLDVALVIGEDIVTLDITMNHMLLVHGFEA